MSRRPPAARAAARAACLVGVAAPCIAFGVESAATPMLPPSTDDRFVFSADGATLTNSNGGAGLSAGWLHNVDADTIGGLAFEHQALSVAQWTFASANGAKTLGPGSARFSFYGEVHEGAGTDEAKSFSYGTEAAGVVGSFFHRLSVQVEDKQIDVLSTHGNLPKVGLSYQWNVHFATTATYQDTVRGNLGTRIEGLRIDETGPKVNFLAGVAHGTASPAVLNQLSGALLATGSTLREAYAGFSMPFPKLRSDLSVVGDYLHLAKSAAVSDGVFFLPIDSTKITITVTYIVHVGAP